jgi:hypothetical protein
MRNASAHPCAVRDGGNTGPGVTEARPRCPRARLLKPDETNAFMGSEEFAANPIREPFDPDELLRRYEAGEPIEDLVFRSDQTHVPIPGVPRRVR